MSTSYRQARSEIVRVISSINKANTNLESSLNRLIQYQKQMKEFLKELRQAEKSAEKGKEYLNEYMTLLYKTQLKIYNE
jgi:exonuclease VII small subunit